MATYTGERLLWLEDVVRAEFSTEADQGDVVVTTQPGWEDRGSVTSDSWTFDIRGVMDHDTGSAAGSTFAGVVGWVTSGSDDAPLCQIVTSSPWAPDTPGYVEVSVVASGKANHAGKGMWQDWLTTSDNQPSSVGNHKTVGVEHFWTPDHDAKGGVHPLHREVQMRLDACLLEHIGQPASRQVDHSEYATPPGRKVDRRYITQPGWRDELADLMAGRKDSDMITDDDVDRIAAEVTRQVLTMLRGPNAESIVRAWMATTWPEFPPGTGPDGQRQDLTVSGALWSAERWSRIAASEAADDPD